MGVFAVGFAGEGGGRRPYRDLQWLSAAGEEKRNKEHKKR